MQTAQQLQRFPVVFITGGTQGLGQLRRLSESRWFENRRRVSGGGRPFEPCLHGREVTIPLSHTAPAPRLASGYARLLRVVHGQYGGVVGFERVFTLKSPVRRSRAGLGVQGVAEMVSLSR